MHVLNPDKVEIEQQSSEEVVRAAVKEFRKLLRGMTQTARALTGKEKMRVLIGAKPHTDGQDIYMRPPLELGRKYKHDRMVCDQRDPYSMQQKCPACAVRESVQATLYHEMGHNIEDTFQKVPGDDVAAIEKALRGFYKDSDSAARALRRVDKYKTYMEKTRGQRWSLSFFELAGLISPYLHSLMNALEDGRINTRMGEARPGFRTMMFAYTKNIFEQGNLNPDGSRTHWRENNPNAQAIIICYLKVMGYDYVGWLKDEITADLDDPTLDRLCEDVRYSHDASGTYALLVPIITRLKELGYCLDNTDPAPEEDDDLEENPGGGDTDPQNDHTTGDDDAASMDAEPDGTGEPGSGEDEGTGDSSDEDEPVDASEGGESAGDPDAGGEDADSGNGERTEDDGSPEGGAGDDDGVEDEGSDDSGGSPDGENPSGAPDDDDAEPSEPAGSEDEGDGDTGGSSNAADQDEDDPEDDGEEAAEGDGEGDGGDAAEDDDEVGGSGGREGDNAEDSPDGDEDLVGADPSLPSPSSGDSGLEAEEEEPELLEKPSGVPGMPWEPEADRPEAPDATEVERLMDEARGHDSDNPEMVAHDHRPEVIQGSNDFGYIPEMDETDHFRSKKDEEPEPTPEEWEQAINQDKHFDRPSNQIGGVHVHGIDDPFWSARSVRRDREAIRVPDEGMMNSALAHTRRVFTENHKHKVENNLKRGRVNARALGRRAWNDDPRLMQRRQRPGKKSYFVLIGVDISLSNAFNGTLPTVKAAVAAQADLLARAGVGFAVYAHTSGYDEQVGPHVAIYEVKGEKVPWDGAAKDRLACINPMAGNLDGHTFEFYRKRLQESRATDRVLMYYCDGDMPAGNYEEELEILQEELRTLDRLGIKKMGVGIGNDAPKAHGLDTVLVMSEADVPKVVKHLEKVLTL